MATLYILVSVLSNFEVKIFFNLIFKQTVEREQLYFLANECEIFHRLLMKAGEKTTVESDFLKFFQSCAETITDNVIDGKLRFNEVSMFLVVF